MYQRINVLIISIEVSGFIDLINTFTRYAIQLVSIVLLYIIL
jgi:hypothetical protein